MCSEEDERVKKETVFGLKQKEAAALLLKRRQAAESHSRNDDSRYFER